MATVEENIMVEEEGNVGAPPPSPMRKLVAVASIAAGVQFGWAPQLSLLTPYVQLLGIEQDKAALIWLCGPISGLFVQPIVGFYSDRCTSRYGRRKPFIASGTALIAVAVLLIGYAADLGRALGDQHGNGLKARAVGIFVVGFWIFDVANNTLQGPCRALLADLSGSDHKKTRTAYAVFSTFMAVGSALGYAASSYTDLYHIAPFTRTLPCDVFCADLKTCLFILILLLLSLTIFALTYVQEKPLSLTPDPEASENNTPPAPCCSLVFQMAGAVKQLKKSMWILLLVTCLNGLAWYPFLVFDTDWMAKDVYGGDPNGTEEQQVVYSDGVKAGAVGLIFMTVVSGSMSLVIEPVSGWVGGAKRLWALVNFIFGLFMGLVILLTRLAQPPPSAAVKGCSWAIFALLGIPQAIIMSGVSGPLDKFFGGHHTPTFLVGGLAAVASGVVALIWLPSPPSNVHA